MKKNVIRARHQMIQRLQDVLHAQGFLSANTPVARCAIDLEPEGPWSVSTPTHGRSQLRDCMELPLRKALEYEHAVYEIGPCFRRDVSDKTHLSEFTMLELFWNRPNFKELIDLIRSLLSAAFNRNLEEFEIVDLAERLPVAYPGVAYRMPFEQLKACAEKYLFPGKLEGLDRTWKIYNALIDQLIDQLLPGAIDRPAMVVNYPMETVCLARPQTDHPERIERTELYVNGIEIGHGFVDDMDVNRVRMRMNENGAEFVDESFLKYLASGVLPASSGVGFGIDRLLMIEQGLSDIGNCVLGDAA